MTERRLLYLSREDASRTEPLWVLVRPDGLLVECRLQSAPDGVEAIVIDGGAVAARAVFPTGHDAGEWADQQREVWLEHVGQQLLG